MGNRFTRAIVAAFLAVLCFAALLGIAGCSCSATGADSSQSSSGALSASDASLSSSRSASSSSSAAVEAVKLPVDFAALKEQNQDIYAWITVPDTAVDLPILQNSFADNYYLVHDEYGNANELGALYTQSMNARDFKDPVTVIYGHTFEHDGVVGDQMFGTLHYFSDETFFKEHPTFDIYLPDKALTYQVVSVYEYDDRHILNSYDFTDKKIQQEYFDYVLNPDSMLKNVRKHKKLEAGKDRIVQLSTCTHPPVDTKRYLITGVLVDEKPAK